MTDINKHIEEARAIEYKQEVDLYSDIYEGLVGYEYAYDLMVSLKIEAYKNRYNKALHSFRWRKVSEELPEYGSIIVAKGDTSDFQDMYLIEIDSDYSISVLTSYYKEWKPID